MLKDITIGQYYRADSVIHRMDPRTKIIGIFALIILLFVCNQPLNFAMAAIFIFVVIKISKVPFKFVLRGIKPLVMILVFTGLINLFFTPGKELVRFYFFKITQEGVEKSIFIIVRIFLLVIISSILTLTSTPSMITDGLEHLMAPLKILHVPVSEIAMMMSIALRFIPILSDEADKIMKAQTARGADFESGNMITRVRKMIPIIIPLFVSAIKRASDLATAMDARCYGISKNRTKLHPLKYHRRDVTGYVIIVIFAATMIGCNYMNLFAG